MKVFQSSNLINATVKQMWGEDAPTVQDVGGLITLGEKVLSSNENKEQFMGVLVDRIKRTVIRVLDLSLDMPNVLLDNNSYFGILQKINVAPVMSKIDNSWNIAEADYSTTIWEINKPNITQTFFNNLSAFTIPMTIPDKMLDSAFIQGTMDGFITAIFSTIEMSMVMFLNALSHLCVCNLIAERIKDEKEINLLTMYNEAFNLTLTADKAIYDADFLKYAGMIIRNYIKYLNHPTVLFNDGTELRATQRDNMHVLMLTDFVSAYSTYYTNDTFHNEMAQLPYFSEVTYWQFLGNSQPNLITNSSINIIPASEQEADTPTAVTQGYIIALLADRQALGVTLVEDWAGADRNNRERYTNYTWGCNRGYFNDLSENAVAFVIK